MWLLWPFPGWECCFSVREGPSSPAGHPPLPGAGPAPPSHPIPSSRAGSLPSSERFRKNRGQIHSETLLHFVGRIKSGCSLRLRGIEGIAPAIPQEAGSVLLVLCLRGLELPASNNHNIPLNITVENFSFPHSLTSSPLSQGSRWHVLTKTHFSCSCRPETTQSLSGLAFFLPFFFSLRAGSRAGY